MGGLTCNHAAGRNGGVGGSNFICRPTACLSHSHGVLSTSQVLLNISKLCQWFAGLWYVTDKFQTIFYWCSHDILLVFQCYITDVPVIFYCYSNNILLVFQWYFIGIPVIFHWYSNISLLFQWYFANIPVLFQWYFTAIPVILHWYSNAILLKFQWYSNDILLVFQWYSGVVDLKKDIQELYGLISYSVLRKKLRGGKRGFAVS